MRIAITGANGFLGRYLGQYLNDQGKQSVGVLRRVDEDFPYDYRVLAALSDEAGLSKLFRDCDAVVHLAAQAHVPPGKSAAAQAGIIETNVNLVETVLRAALDARVQKFVFISSVKVYGETTSAEPLRADSPHRPADIYGQSKHEAEQRIHQLTRDSAIQPTIIQPPLIYGHNVKGNLQSLLKVMRLGLPLPFAAISNRRDVVALPVISDLINTCLDSDRSAHQTFLVADGQTRSTAEIIELLGRIHGIKARLFGLPPSLLKGLFALPGLSSLGSRLLSDLRVDISHTTRVLGWHPEVPDPASLRSGYQ